MTSEMIVAQVMSDLCLTDAEALMRGDLDHAAPVVNGGSAVVLERVQHPWQPESGADWYVLVDTMIGQSVGAWQTDRRVKLLPYEQKT